MTDREPRERREALKNECGASDGYSVCTEPPGHGPTHWDRHTKHEWHEADDPLLLSEGELRDLRDRYPPEGTEL